MNITACTKDGGRVTIKTLFKVTHEFDIFLDSASGEIPELNRHQRCNCFRENSDLLWNEGLDFLSEMSGTFTHPVIDQNILHMCHLNFLIFNEIGQ